MSASIDLLESLQADVHAILAATPALSSTNILSDDQGDLENRVARSLGPLSGSGGKAGLVIVILLPEVTEADSNLPGPPLTLKVEIRTLENVVTNRAGPSSLRSSQAALCVLGALHQQGLGGHVLYTEKDPVTPVDVKPGHTSHAVTLYARVNGLQTPGKPAAVDASLTAGRVSLSCATTGSKIYYTIDGSYPSAAKGTLYTTPFTAPSAGVLVRAAAYKATLNPGDCLEFTITS